MKKVTVLIVLALVALFVFAACAQPAPQAAAEPAAEGEPAAEEPAAEDPAAEEPAAENAYLYHLTGEKQAISVTVKAFANGLSGKLKSGDIVSVIAPDYRKQGKTVIPAELQYVEVIAVTANSGYDANTGEELEDGADRELPGTVTLLVTPEQSMVLAELEADGKLHLSLVYRGDEKSAGQFLEAQNQMLTELYPPEDMEGEAEENEALDHSDKEPEETKAEEQEETRQGETEESGVE